MAFNFLCIRSYYLQIMTILLLPFQFRCLYFEWLFLARTSNIVLNKRMGTQPFIVDTILAVGVPYYYFLLYLFLIFTYVPYMPNLLKVFIMKHILYQMLSFESLEMIIRFLSFILLMWSITFIDLWLIWIILASQG